MAPEKLFPEMTRLCRWGLRPRGSLGRAQASPSRVQRGTRYRPCPLASRSCLRLSVLPQRNASRSWVRFITIGPSRQLVNLDRSRATIAIGLRTARTPQEPGAEFRYLGSNCERCSSIHLSVCLTTRSECLAAALQTSSGEVHALGVGGKFGGSADARSTGRTAVRQGFPPTPI